MKNIRNFLIVVITIVALNSCSRPDGDFGGSEYMPDMAHSIAQEANVYAYYKYNTWDDESTIKLKDLANLNDPVKGTVPRGYAGVAFAASDDQRSAMEKSLNGMNSLNEMNIPINGSVPYYYEDTEDERNRAMAEIIENPYPITEDGLARGKDLYTINCTICHGDKGNGLGYIVDDSKNSNVKYPAAPANFTTDAFLASSNGRFYHAIMYGKNVMGAFSDKLSYEERWQVIHYIRSLQAKSNGTAYNQLENTLNAAYGTPAGPDEPEAKHEEDTHENEQHSSDDHSGGH
jgi:mono/diheme cytochrome c family protein